MNSTQTLTRFLVAASAVLCLAGCAAAPGTTGGGAALQRVDPLVISVVTNVAVHETVARGNASAAVQAERAAKIVAVASALKALGQDALSTLPQVTAALTPLLDKAGLDPYERQNADILVQALVTAVLQRTDAGKAYATVSALLDNVIKSASIYIPKPTG